MSDCKRCEELESIVRGFITRLRDLTDPLATEQRVNAIVERLREDRKSGVLLVPSHTR